LDFVKALSACRAVALLSCVERWTLNSFHAGNCCQTAGANFAPTWIFCSEMLKVFGKPADGDVISLKK